MLDIAVRCILFEKQEKVLLSNIYVNTSEPRDEQINHFNLWGGKGAASSGGSRVVGGGRMDRFGTLPSSP